MTTIKRNEGYRLPAEWEPQSGIQLTWPHAGTDWKPYLKEITDTFVELVREFARREQVLIVTPDVESTRSKITEQLGNDVLLNITFFECETNDTWARDHGAITMVSEHIEGNKIEKYRLLDFRFNGWGEKFDWEKDNAITPQLSTGGVLSGTLESHDDFVLEGGAIESDGHGTVMTTSTCLLAPHRNQPLDREDIELRLREWFNAERIVWLDHGQLIGDDTDGHIDTLVRMAPDNTLLYVGCDDESDPQFAELYAMEEELRALRTLQGNPYRLLRLPMPRAIYYDDDRLPATYANFVILNEAVIVPTYGQPDLDEEAMDLVGQAFPDREIVGIDAKVVVRQHGSLHCLTMQQPK